MDISRVVSNFVVEERILDYLETNSTHLLANFNGYMPVLTNNKFVVCDPPGDFQNKIVYNANYKLYRDLLSKFNRSFIEVDLLTRSMPALELTYSKIIKVKSVFKPLDESYEYTCLKSVDTIDEYTKVLAFNPSNISIKELDEIIKLLCEYDPYNDYKSLENEAIGYFIGMVKVAILSGISKESADYVLRYLWKEMDIPSGSIVREARRSKFYDKLLTDCSNRHIKIFFFGKWKYSIPEVTAEIKKPKRRILQLEKFVTDLIVEDRSKNGR